MGLYFSDILLYLIKRCTNYMLSGMVGESIVAIY